MRKVSGFTLVELLVVIAIMIIIMGFSVPLFSKLSFGNAVDGASRMISSQLSLARAEAVAKRQYIAIIMPGKDFNAPNGDDETDEYHFRSFRAAIVEEGSNSKQFDFVKWFPGTEWGFLPNGAVIAEADGDAVTTSTSATGIECLEDYNGTELKSRHVAEKWLDSNKLQSDDNTTMTIVKDTDSATMVEGQDNKTDGVRAIIFQPNGRVVGGQNMYVTLVEGVPTGGSPYILSNGNKENMRLMKINQYTGKITYLDVHYDKD
ncbi:MAG: prepilin-type N-terminal cleavage/methylation domain-containing protein [Victivallales bacterium]|nr:prepilin-type N-terminal cleavage/methylation domain-containing protein [Victivallales bacterium]